MESNKKIHNLQSLKKTLQNSNKVGLFGGSFYPAHVGHLEISKYALSFLDLDYILWIVAEQNPLKPPYKMDLASRCDYALRLNDEPKILITDIEKEINSKYSYETIKFFYYTFPKTKFTWIMGVDCLKEFHLWQHYKEFSDLVDIAIFDRPGYQSYMESTIAGKELLKSSKNRVIFCQDKMIDISSSAIRAKSYD